MKLARVLFFLMILGTSAIAAYAQTPIDPTVNLHYPDPSSCAAGSFCVNIMYTGGPALFTIIPNDPLVFSVPNPPGEYPATLFPPTYKCESNVLVGVPTGQIGPPTEFTGCDFYGYLPGSETFTLSVTGGSGIVLALPTDFGCVTPSECHMVNGQDVVDLSPEPATALLYVTGLVLLVGFARKRFGADILA